MRGVDVPQAQHVEKFVGEQPHPGQVSATRSVVAQVRRVHIDVSGVRPRLSCQGPSRKDSSHGRRPWLKEVGVGRVAERDDHACRR